MTVSPDCLIVSNSIWNKILNAPNPPQTKNKSLAGAQSPTNCSFARHFVGKMAIHCSSSSNTSKGAKAPPRKVQKMGIFSKPIQHHFITLAFFGSRWHHPIICPKKKINSPKELPEPKAQIFFHILLRCFFPLPPNRSKTSGNLAETSQLTDSPGIYDGNDWPTEPPPLRAY